MNESNNEQLSSFIDGEHYGEHALDNLIHNQHMKDTWSRYHLIGDCLRDNLPKEISNQVSTQVSNVLRDEPTILAPKTTKRFNTKSLIGFAIAASVAMVAVFSIQSGNEIDSSSNGVPAIAATTAAQPQTFNFSEPQVLPAAIKKSDTPDSVGNQRLNNYLINHNEYRINGGVNAILPYVRIVTTEVQE
jgi:sigma-E factor negative regulatory protein RseA